MTLKLRLVENGKTITQIPLFGRNGYRCSGFGETSFMMMSLAFTRHKKTLEEMDDF